MKVRVYGASFAALATALGSTAAQAQTPAVDNQIQEIVVTAQKRAENIQNVPLSIVAVTGSALETAGIRDATQLSKLVPALKIDQSLASAAVNIRIRGFGSPGGTAVDSDVAAYIDGAFVSRPGTILSSFLDVKTIEVLSGPQGTLFGRNASMGAVSINTNVPSNTSRSLEVKAEGGSYGTFSGSAVANLPVNNDFALRFAMQASHTDGLYRNVLDGKTYGRSNGLVGRLSAKLNLSPNLVWIVRADAAKTKGDQSYPFSGAPNATPAQVAAFAAFVTGNGGTPPVLGGKPSFTVNQSFANPTDNDRQYGVTSNLSWTVTPAMTVRVINSYRDWKNEQRTPDSIGTSLRLLNIFLSNRSKAQSHELQLVSAKDAFLDGKLGITSGLYYFHEKYDFGVGFNLGPDFCRVVYSAIGLPFLINPCQAGPQANAGVSSFAQSANSYAIYSQLNYKILPSLELDIGGRYSWDRKSGSLLTSAPNPFNVIAVPESQPSLKFSDRRPSVRASLSWHIADKTMVFATYSTGYKSGGFNSGVTNPPLTAALRTFSSETVQDYELGGKSVFLDGKARFNATFFNTNLKNFQDRSFNGTSFVIRNSGDVRSRGVDIDGEFVGPSGLRLNYGVTHLDSIYSRNTNAPGLEGCTGGPGCPTVQDLSGRRVPYAPKWQGNVGLGWTGHPVGSALVLSLKAAENFSSSFFTSNTLNRQSRLPGYATTDFNISLAPADAKWKLDVFALNLFNKHYFVNTIAQVLAGVMPGVNDPATGATVFRGFAGDPRRFGARLTGKF